MVFSLDLRSALYRYIGRAVRQIKVFKLKTGKKQAAGKAEFFTRGFSGGRSVCPVRGAAAWIRQKRQLPTGAVRPMIRSYEAKRKGTGGIRTQAG